MLSLRPLVFGGCLGQMASEGREPCLQAMLMGTGLVARKCFDFSGSYIFPQTYFSPKKYVTLNLKIVCPSWVPL